MRRARVFGERVRRVAAWSAVALVSWQAAVSVLEVRDELGGRPFREHVRCLTASPEELIRSRLGTDFEIWSALRARLPHDAWAVVSFLDRRQDHYALRRRLTKLESLVYPIKLKGWPFDPSRPALGPGKAVSKEYVLDLESGRDYSGWQCEELARGQGFRLFRVGNRTAGSDSSASEANEAR